MPATQDPNFDLNYGWDLGENGWKDGMDDNLKKLGATAFLHVLSATTIAEPGSPTSGDRYILPVSATGIDWAGNDKKVAVYNIDTWEFYTPAKGWVCKCEDDNQTYYYNSVDWLEQNPSILCLGDSITNDGYPSHLATLMPSYKVVDFAISSQSSTDIVKSQLIDSCGQISFDFYSSFYPWVDSATVGSIIGDRLRVYKSAADYMSLPCLNSGKSVTISGNFASDGTSYIVISTSGSGVILTTSSDGNFTIDYTPVADFEEIRILVTGGIDGVNYIDIRNIDIVQFTQTYTQGSRGVLLVGTNDVAVGIDAGVIVEAISFIHEQFSRAGLPLSIMGILDNGPAAYDDYKKMTFEIVNFRIKSITDNYIDTSPMSDGTYLRTEFDTDGVHPNALGDAFLADIVYANTMGIVVNGSYDINKFPIKTPPNVNVDMVPTIRIAQNDIEWSQTFTSAHWSLVSVSSMTKGVIPSCEYDNEGNPIYYWEMVSNTSNTLHYIRLSTTIKKSGTQRFEALFKRGGVLGWLHFRLATPAVYDVYVNTDTLEISSISNPSANIKFLVDGEHVKVLIDVPGGSEGDVADVRIFADLDGQATPYAGDGVSVYTYLAYVSMAGGKNIDDDIQHVDTSANEAIEHKLSIMIPDLYNDKININVAQTPYSLTEFNIDKIFIAYTSTGVATITIQNALINKDWNGVLIVDSDGNAAVNNITVQDSVAGLIGTIATNGGSLFVCSDGVGLFSR